MKKSLLISAGVVISSFQIIAQGLVDSSLVGYFPMEGNANDFSIYSNNGLIFGDPQCVAGINGNAFLFDGVDDYLQIPPSISLNSLSNEFTIAGWVFPLGFYNGYVVILTKGNQPGTLTPYSIIYRSGSLYPHLRYTGSNMQNIILNLAGQPGCLQLNTWNYIAWRFQNGALDIFLNENIVASHTFGFDALLPNAQPLEFARDRPGAQEFFHGILDEFCIFNRALSNQEIVGLFNQGKATQNGIKTELEIEICQGSSFEGYTETGLYIDTLSTLYGCDSIRMLSLSVVPPNIAHIELSICEGTVLDWNGQQLSVSGTYSAVLTGANGCDSIAQLSLAVLPTAMSNEELSICEGAVLDWNGQQLSVSGTYSAVLTGANGCDSIAQLSLAVLPTAMSNEELSICEGAVLDWNGQQLSASGTYTMVLTGANGCDSIAQLSLAVLPTAMSNEELSICEGAVLDWNGQELSASGAYTAVLTGANGCDSIQILNLTVFNGIEPTIIDTIICEGGAVFGYTRSGTYIDTFSHPSGCDSIRILNLIVRSIYLPNAFSPNNDGKNDYFGVFVENTQSLALIEVKIFSRWGGLVYQFDANEENNYSSYENMWDGSINGQPAQKEVYIYYISYTCKETDKVLIKTGDLLLTR